MSRPGLLSRYPPTVITWTSHHVESTSLSPSRMEIIQESEAFETVDG